MKTKAEYDHIEPCYFCGGLFDSDDVRDYSIGFHVECDNCKASGPVELSEQEAVNSWNRNVKIERTHGSVRNLMAEYKKLYGELK